MCIQDAGQNACSGGEHGRLPDELAEMLLGELG